MDSEFSIDLAGVPGHLSLGFGQGWNRRKLREVENGAESASCDFSALAIKEKSAQEEGEGGLLRRRRRREVCPGGGGERSAQEDGQWQTAPSLCRRLLLLASPHSRQYRVDCHFAEHCRILCECMLFQDALASIKPVVSLTD